MIRVNKTNKYVSYEFDNDEDNKRLRLIVILSPIFIASFDNGNSELEFLKNTIENSKFPYGLYPHYFDDFNKNDYRNAYKNYNVLEDIYLTDDNKIRFYINPMDDDYILSLKTLIEELLLNDSNLNELITYFDKIRDDIVINGRRSILANDIQGFYLQKYVVVRMIDLCEMLIDQNSDLAEKIDPIYKLSNNLKTPRIK